MYTLLYKPSFCTQHILETRMVCANLLLFVPILLAICARNWKEEFHDLTDQAVSLSDYIFYYQYAGMPYSRSTKQSNCSEYYKQQLQN